MKLDLSKPAPQVARDLIGSELLIGREGNTCGGIIIETEAYTADDPASHSFRGLTLRNRAMFMVPGTIYVYRIYGMHYCMNIVCGQGDGQAVLLRALKPTVGIEAMKRRRGTDNLRLLASGPARLTQALGVDLDYSGVHIDVAGWKLRAPEQSIVIHAGPRVGISKAVDVPWRFRADEYM